MGDYGNSTRRCALCAALIRNTAKKGDALAASAPPKNTPKNTPKNRAATAPQAPATPDSSATLKRSISPTHDSPNISHLKTGLGSSAAQLLAGNSRGGNKQLFYPYQGIAINANLAANQRPANNKQTPIIAATRAQQLNQLVTNSRVSLLTSLLPVVLLWSLLLLIS